MSKYSMERQMSLWPKDRKLPKGWKKNIKGHSEDYMEIQSDGSRKHKHPFSVTYGSWFGTIKKIYYEKSYFDSYGHYDDVLVCARWVEGDGENHGFLCFLEDMGLRPDHGITIPKGKRGLYRIGRKGDVGHYTPKNCEWETRADSFKVMAEKRKRKKAAA